MDDMSSTPHPSGSRSSMLGEISLSSRRYSLNKNLSTEEQIMQEFSRYPTNPSTPPVNEMHLNGSSLPAEWIGEATERALLPLKQGMDKMYKKLYNGIASTIVDSHAHPQSSSTLPQHLVETVRLHQEDNKRLRQENRELLHRDERREREMLGLRSEIHALNAETRQLRTALHMAENRALEVCTKYQAALEQGSRLMNEARMVRASTANASSGVRDAPEPESMRTRIPQTAGITVYRSSSRPNQLKRPRGHREPFELLGSALSSRIEGDASRPTTRLRVESPTDHRKPTLNQSSLGLQNPLGHTALSSGKGPLEQRLSTTSSSRLTKSPGSFRSTSSMSIGAPGTSQRHSPESRDSRALSFPPIASLEADVQMDDLSSERQQGKELMITGLIEVDGQESVPSPGQKEIQAASPCGEGEAAASPPRPSSGHSSSSASSKDRPSLQRAPTPPWVAATRKEEQASSDESD